MNQWLQAAISQLHIPAILSAHREQRLRNLSQSTNLTGLHQLSKQVFVRNGLFLHSREQSLAAIAKERMLIGHLLDLELLLLVGTANHLSR